MKPTISINIPCYNRSEMLKECINSFISQTFEDWELILVDDGSEEDLTFVEKMDKRVKYYRIEHSGIPAKGFNVALSKSSGKYIMPFGSDDMALPELLRMTKIELESSDLYDVIYTDCWQQYNNRSLTRKKHDEYTDFNKAYEEMLKYQYISHGGSLWKKEKVPIYDETVGPAEDWELFLTAMENGVRFKRLNFRLWTYRIGHPRVSCGQPQIDGCNKVLGRRGYRFDPKTRRGVKI